MRRIGGASNRWSTTAASIVPAVATKVVVHTRAALQQTSSD